MSRPLFCALLACGALLGCEAEPTETPPTTPDEAPADPATVEFEARPPPVPRLTAAQYANSIAALFGDDIVVPPEPEPDAREGGLLAVGAGVSTLSPRGVENFERAAYAVAGQVLDAERRDRVLPCPAAELDRSCMEAFTAEWGRRIWRRPLTADEITRLAEVGERAGETLGDAVAGLEYTLAGLLQSPNFLFRRELGEPDPADAGRRRFTDYEMAARLSFLLWNVTPDDALLDAAEAGELTTAEGLRAHAERMYADPRSRDGVMRIFIEWLGLDDLDELRKDTAVFVAMSPEVGSAARTETLSLIDDLVFARDADFRGFLTERRTFVDRKLAALYGVRAPARDGFAPVDLTGSGRRGFLGQVSFLALNSHPTSTSATLRGKFVREKLLCQVVPPPPSDVDTSIPEPSGTTRTLRERVAEHLTNPACAGCHELTDKVGLAFETFDGLGVARTLDHGAVIDPSGDLDGVPFSDADQLVELIAGDPGFGFCVARHVFRYGTGTLDARDQEALVQTLADRFAADGHRFEGLLFDFIASPAFREAGRFEAGDVEAGDVQGGE